MKICGIWPENSGTNDENSCYIFKVAAFGETTSGQTRASLIFPNELNEKLLAGLSSCLLRIQRSFWKIKFETTKKTVSILNDKLSNFEQLLFVRAVKTAWYESIGTSCAKNICRKQCHIIFHSFSFGAINFQCGAETAFYVFRGKVYLLFFSEFSSTLPGFWATVFEKECQNRTLCYQWYLLQEKKKNFNFKTSHWVSRTIFRKCWQNHFSFVRGQFLETNFFFAKTLHYGVFNFFIEKTTNIEKKHPTVLTKLLLMSTAKQCGKKNNFSKENCLLTNLLPTSGWKFTAVFPRLLSANWRIHSG